MLSFNRKHIPNAAELQRELLRVASTKEFVSGMQEMIYAWGLDGALKILGQALYGYDDRQTYDNIGGLIQTSPKKGKL